MNSRLVTFLVAVLILPLVALSAFAEIEPAEPQQAQFETNHSEALNTKQSHVLYKNLLLLENQIQQLCGIPCDLALKKDTWFESAHKLYSTGCNLVKLFATTVLLLGTYHAIANKLEEDYSHLRGRLTLSVKQNYMLISLSFLGFFGAGFFNKISPLCIESCENLREVKMLISKLLPDELIADDRKQKLAAN